MVKVFYFVPSFPATVFQQMQAGQLRIFIRSIKIDKNFSKLILGSEGSEALHKLWDCEKIEVTQMVKGFFNFVPSFPATVQSGQLKFGLSEKHTKFEKIFLMVLTNQLIYLVNVKTMRKIFSNYVCFSESPNFGSQSLLQLNQIYYGVYQTLIL